MPTLVLLRHGQSIWNEENRFTGWHDVDLTAKGEAEARRGGQQMLDAGVLPDVVHTSLQTRAIRTATLALEVVDRVWIPVRRHWRLNERHYGALQGKNKSETAAEFGEDQVKVWRRSYDVPPPPVALDDPEHPSQDSRYAMVPADVLPASECLKDVGERMLPYWYDAICPDLVEGRTTLVAAHGNSLRALKMHLDGMSEAEVLELNIPTGMPLVYELDERLRVVSCDYLDPEAAAVEAAKVAAQGSIKT